MGWDELGGRVTDMSFIFISFILLSVLFVFIFITDRMTAACHKLSGTSHCLVSAGKKLQRLTSGVQGTCVLSAVPSARCTC